MPNIRNSQILKFMGFNIVYQGDQAVGKPFAAMVHQLLPNADLKLGNVEVNKLALTRPLLANEGGEKGNADTLLQHRGHDIGSPDLKRWQDLYGMSGKRLVKM